MMLVESDHESVRPVKVFVHAETDKTARCYQCCRRAIYWHGVYLCREHAEQLAIILRRLEVGAV